MRELMLRLLTYEPFEAISGDEKKYIDAVLAGNINFSQTFPLYDELMNALMYFCNQSGDTTKLVSWFNAFYSFSKAGNIGILCDQATGERTYYPVLFKKICFYCITEYNLRDADFLKQFGIKPNILNKWEISPRYRKLINRDSYHAINIRRNGKKQPYLTKVIKSAFYEASRQEAALRFFDPATKGWVAPKKEQLLPFIDVFAGSGCVAASVDANEMVVNDFDIGVACFLYSMSHDEKEVRTRLAELHKSFVRRDLSNGANHYTSDMWMEHKRKVRAYSKITDVAYDELMIRLRNNYEEIYKMYISALDEVAVDFSNPSQKDIQMYYDIGVAWYFINAIDANGFSGNVHKITDMDTDNYYAYLENKLEVFKANSEGVVPFQKLLDKYSGVSYKIISNLTLKPKDIKFGDGRSFMKELKKSHVQSTDFSQLVKTFSDGFIYEDSPYFLTTGYNPDFGDEQHKIMLDQLRDADFKWLFSMQYYEFRTNSPKKDKKKREDSGEILIKNYHEYYGGFTNKYKVERGNNGIRYYVIDGDINMVKADELYVLLFEPPKKINEEKIIDENGDYDEDLKDAYMEKNSYKVDTREMMICNFDMRRVIPYGDSCLVLPFRKFLEYAFYENGCERNYQYIRSKAREYRAQKIQENYYTGGRV